MKVCFVGAGSIGKRHIRNFKKLSEEHGFFPEIHLLRSSNQRLESDIEQMVYRQWYQSCACTEKYDAIFITNPTCLHYQSLLELKECSDCFFIEKPVFSDIKADLSVFEQPEKNIYYTACPLRYTKVLQMAKQIADSEQVISVRGICSSYLPDWRPGTDYRTVYSACEEQGGGVRADLIHEWDYLSWLFGFPDQVFQMSGKYSDLEIRSRDLAVYIAKYRDKLAELHLDYFGRQTRRSLEMITSDNFYVFDIAGGHILKNGQLYAQFDEKPNDKYMEELRYFYRLMQGREVNANHLQHAVRTMQIALGS